MVKNDTSLETSIEMVKHHSGNEQTFRMFFKSHCYF